MGPGPLDSGPGTQEPPQSLKVGPGTPLKFKIGTLEPPSKFKKGPQDPLQSLKVEPYHNISSLLDLLCSRQIYI